jgi:hypothetical protein
MKREAGFVRKAAKWASVGCVLAGVSLSGAAAPEQAEAKQTKKPNIVVIWGDDIGQGWWVYLRFYAPTKAYFDKSWSMGDFEKAK